MNNLNYRLTIPAILLVLASLTLSSLFPVKSQEITMHAMHFVTSWFGWLVELVSLALVIFLLWLAFSKYGSIRLSKEKPEYSNFSYGGMIFTAGVGASLIYWGIGEPSHYLQSPPLFAEANSYTAAAWSVTYSIFHWGITGWAIYCFPAIPFAYAFYVEKKRVLRLSTLCAPVVGNNAWIALGIDLVAIFGTLGAFASSLSLTVNLLSVGISELTGVNNSLWLQGGIILLFVIVLMTVMLSDFNKGISQVSNYTVIATFGFTIFVLFSSDTQFILNNFTDSIGVLLNNFFRMSLWTDPVQKSGFPQAWTQYYWFWYYAYLIMMGLFIMRISRGRTIKEVILYSISMGALGCALIISVFGGYAIWAQLLGGFPVNIWIQDGGLTFAIVKLIQVLPTQSVALIIFLIIQFFLMLTTMSSASVATSMLTTKELELNGNPDNKVKILWMVAIALISFSVFLSGGGIDTIKSLCMIAGLPMMFIYMILVKQLMFKLSTSDHELIDNPTHDFNKNRQ